MIGLAEMNPLFHSPFPVPTPPPSASTSPDSSHKHPHPTHVSHHGSMPKSIKTRYVLCAGSSRDDYHATLRALNSRSRSPKKWLGQHYMLNSSINEQLVHVADVREGDVVLEIGPGTGSLTSVLVNAGATVLAIEKDPEMTALVRERFEDTDRLQVLLEDFTKCHVRSHLLALQNRISLDADLRHAKDEAALRLVDDPLRTAAYRPINIFVNFYSVPEYKCKVQRTNFFPQPKVDAAIVAFKLKQPWDYPGVSSVKSFFSMVNSAFNGKRKMLRRSLLHIRPSVEIEAALQKAHLPPTSRPEELTLDDFVRLHNMITNV